MRISPRVGAIQGRAALECSQVTLASVELADRERRSARGRNSACRGFLVWAIALIGCGSAVPSGTEIAPNAEPLHAGAPVVAPNVSALEAVCAPGAEERCDALDSDCDGQIDEGCDGVQAGVLSVAAAWTGHADVDLRLEGPGSAQAQMRRSEGNCAADGAEPSRERLSMSTLVKGEYRVLLRLVRRCSTAGQASDAPLFASVSVSVAGDTLGIFNRALSEESEVELVRFHVGPR